jgi:Protein of unknown function (DUF1549)/Protein of unknown function (DUF1553)
MTIKAPNSKFQNPKKLQYSKLKIFGGWSLGFFWCLGFGVWSLSAAPALTDLQCYPTNVNLSSAKSTQRLVVQATYADGITRDVTDQASLKLTNSKIVRLDRSHLSPIADGQTELHVSYKGRKLSIPISVSYSTNQPAISFRLDVMPVFMKAGCNAGSCHGSSRGKDGFRLSLFGFDLEGDYYRLTREQIGRRINLAIPEESLIIQKGLGAVQHTGGVRFGTNSDLCKTLLTWLNSGAPKDPPDVAKVTGIEIFPKSAVLEGSDVTATAASSLSPSDGERVGVRGGRTVRSTARSSIPQTGSSQRFLVRARYSNGAERDITPLTVFISNNDATAKVDDAGLVTAGQRGEAFIQARFAEFNVGAQVIVTPKNLPFKWPDLTSRNYVDDAVYAKLKKLRFTPSDVCDDATFIRRASVDLNGTLPKPDEVEKFLQDTDSSKRDKLVGQLLARKEFAELWVMKWAELLEIRTRDNRVYPKATVLYFEWLRDQMLANVPFDRIVQNILTASESNFRNPAANYYQIEPDTLKLAENTAQVFMGMRIQCAQCHNHPFDRWTMNDYYSFAAFFAQIGRKPGDDPRETVIYDRNDGEVNHLVTGKPMHPKFLGGDDPEIKGESRREVLARWLTSPQNPYFARNLANMVWAHFMGRGIIEPVDDVRISNPPSNPELLDALAAKFVEYKYDFKRVVRDICSSRTYQLSTRPNSSNASDDRNFSKAAIRRIRAEVLLDCISQVTETQDKFPGLPRGARAVEIADGNSANYFLTTFGRASRTTVCSCEVKVDPNLSQALHLLNGRTLQSKIEDGSVVKNLLRQGQSPDQIIENLYLRCFSRKPTDDEMIKLKSFIAPDSNQEQVLNDIFWSLLNAKEFVFNH